MCKIVVDENIADYLAFFGPFGSIDSRAGREISREYLLDADALVVRSVTNVDRHLLEGSSVRFVGSATAGTDHIDIDYLETAGIEFRHAPGSNAESVAEYVVAALLHLGAITDSLLTGKSLGILGLGQTGGRVARRAEALGMIVRACDPPLEAEGRTGLVSLEEVLACDVISLHVPLTSEGDYPTHHLINRWALDRMPDDVWLINAARGAVINGGDLLAAKQLNKKMMVVLDVWEDEPTPDLSLLNVVDLASPHVAGYSYDGKRSGSAMIAEALKQWRAGSAEMMVITPDENPLPERKTTRICPRRDNYLSTDSLLHDLVQQMHDVQIDDQSMREMLSMDKSQIGFHFTSLRRTYRRRRTFRAYSVSAEDLEAVTTINACDVVEQVLRCRVIG